LQVFGLQGLAYSRLWYGLIPMLIYIPLGRELRFYGSEKRSQKELPIACHEGSAQ